MRVHKVIMLSAALFLGACTSTSCFKSVAVSELTVAEAAKTVTSLNESRIISLDKAEKAQAYIHDAHDMLDGAAERCVLDEKGTFNTLDSVDLLVNKATNVLKDEK